MSKLIWATDTHLNFIKREDGALQFAQYLAKENPKADGLIISGDISDGPNVERHLTQLAKGFGKPIYFVLGNHDYYHKSFKATDDCILELTKKIDNLHWLNLGSASCNGISIVGVCGWYDARVGNTRTHVEIMDFTAIEDLWGGLNYRDLMIDLVRKRAVKEAERLDALLFEEICNVDADTVLVVTHVSPYPGSCWHRGQLSDRDWLPWFCSITTGEVLDKYAENHPEKKFVVLCGHGHSHGIYQRANNLVVYTGGAEYYLPNLAGHIDFDAGKIFIKDSFGVVKAERQFP